MSLVADSFVALRNGRPADAEDLTPLAFAGYAHFTAMQARAGRVRGLDLHLRRLRAASMTMFGQALPDQRVLAQLRTALNHGPENVSLLATVYSPTGEFTASDPSAQLDLLIRTSPAASGPSGPLALSVVEYERYLPAIKHVGEVAKTHAMRQAALQGFDDAAFVDRHGRFSEASIWNLAFWDGRSVVWPQAEMLGGTTMGIVRRQLQNLGVAQREQEIRAADLADMAGAVVMNSWTPGVAVHRIGDSALPPAPEFLELLHRAYRAEPEVAP
ncbi:aminotransferase class IV family protein [Pseudomonas sp. CGJS7]|uniref:aminotransferase class IV family protein n=1 Tax=Pseudomonas sp. CGJS7 TaxID=3109348 RepID=UPI0030087285